MATNLKIDGNFFVLSDTDTTADIFRKPRNLTTFDYKIVGGNDIFTFESLNSQVRDLHKVDFTDIIDNRTGSAFTSVAELTAFLGSKLGTIDSTVVSNTSTLIIVSVKEDFPTPVSNIITLADNVTYYITADIDLTGDRLVSGQNTTLIGGSSENCSITSTGLGSGVAILTSVYTTPIRHITIKDVDTALDFDGTGNTMALDWNGVNIENVPNIGTIKEFSNFIFSKGAFLNSQGLIFDGNFDTVALNNSLFQGDGSAGNIIEIPSTAVISRRFRIIYSAVIAFGSTTALNINSSATIPVEGYILDTVNFSGGGTYTSGVLYNDNKALFVNCRGVQNSSEVAQYYMNGNATTTVIGAAGTPTKVLGTTTNSSITEKFTHTDNRATYAGAITRIFKVSTTLSCESGNNNQVGCYIAKNGLVISESEVYITTNGAGRYEGATMQTLLQMETGDYIEIFVENKTSANNILVTDLNTIIK